MARACLNSAFKEVMDALRAGFGMILSPLDGALVAVAAGGAEVEPRLRVWRRFFQRA